MRVARLALILGLAGVGCATVRGAGSDSNSIPERPEGAPYPNWEHMCVSPSFGGSSDLLNEAGEQGWELVAITTEGTYCFKRPSPPPGGSFPPPPGPPPPPSVPPVPPVPPPPPAPESGVNPYAVPPAPPPSLSPPPPPPPDPREENPFAH